MLLREGAAIEGSPLARVLAEVQAEPPWGMTSVAWRAAYQSDEYMDELGRTVYAILLQAWLRRAKVARERPF